MSLLARIAIILLGIAVLAEIVGIFFYARVYALMGGEHNIAELAPFIAAAVWIKLVGWVIFIAGVVTAVVAAIRHKPVPNVFTAVSVLLVAAFCLLQILAPFFGTYLGTIVDMLHS